MTTVEIAISLPRETYRAIARYAQADGVSVANWLRRAAECEAQRREWAEYGNALRSAGFGGADDRRRLRQDRAAKKRREREAGLNDPRRPA